MWRTVLFTVLLISTHVACFVNTLQNLSLSVTSVCDEQLGELFANFSVSQKSWALQMVDASSKLPPNELYIKYGDLGDFQQCITTAGRDILGKYCLGYINDKNVEKAVQVPTWALCVPSECTTNDVNVIGNALFKTINVTITFPDILCQTINDAQPVLTAGAVTAIISLVVLASGVLLCTLYDVYCEFYGSQPCPVIIKAFSTYTNGNAIFKMSTATDLPCLNGLRVITMAWVVAHHQFSISKYGTTVNPSQMLNWYDSLRSMFLISGHIAVDTFLIIGGTLMSYGFMKTRSKNSTSFNPLLYYLHRYLRLTAPLSLVVLVSATLLKYMGSGPKWPFLVQYFQGNCERYWWTALLYIQNYVNVSEMCVGQTWYLDIDMQLCIISPLVFFALWKYPKVFVPVVSLCVVPLAVVPFYVAWENNLPAIVSNLYSTHTNDYMNKYYLLTHTRCVPWIFGVLLGYYLHTIKQNKAQFRIKRITVFVTWIVSLGTLLACVLGGHSTLRTSDYDKWGNSLHIALVRPAWSLAVGWIILACYVGYAGPVNWVLSLPIYQVLNKFTYSVYLTHVTLLYAITYGRKSPDTFSDFNMAYEFWSTLSFSGALAILLVFVAECPVAAIEKLLIATFNREGTTRNRDVENGVTNDAFEK